MQLVLLLDLLALLLSAAIFPSLAAVDKCIVCTRITKAFQRGLERTAKANFGGGNTQWEESRLGSYGYSETRLVDITERLCAEESKDDALVCHSLVENLEEAVESWWAKQFRENQAKALAAMRQLLCVKEAGVCCPYNSFGPKCSACPSAEGSLFCSARGTCNGNGTKSGSGACDCDLGYTGSVCSECSSGFYGNSTTQLHCEQCDTACKSCIGPSASNCSDCASGYEPQGGSQPGPQPTTCQDVDECLTQCKGEFEMCTNSPGSFSCDCKQGYERVEGACQKKEEEEEKEKGESEKGEIEKESEREDATANDGGDDSETEKEDSEDKETVSSNENKDEL